MGLDMYLVRYPRYKNRTPRELNAAVEYNEWRKDPNAQKHSLEEWCGVKEEDLPPEEEIQEIIGLCGPVHSIWDKTEVRTDICEYVAYWRKANAIHRWFVNRVQDGKDDCAYHSEVTREILEELRDTCKKVLEESTMVHGVVQNGYRLKGGKETPILERGLTVINPEVCKKLLPTESGFFFGGTGYDQWYISSVQHTYEVCCRLLEETDFDRQMIFYASSW